MQWHRRESGQSCTDKDGAAYNCGQRSSLFMSNLTAGKTLDCRPLGHDRYGRTSARCKLGAVDVGSTEIYGEHHVARYMHGRQKERKS